MKTQQRTIYRCDFCREHRLSKEAAANHERYCKHNPANKHKCFGCQHLVVEQGVGENGRRCKQFTCAALNKSLYSYKAEKRNMFRAWAGGPLPDDVERMPLECAAFCVKLIDEPAELPF